jgi:hypothetical protein
MVTVAVSPVNDAPVAQDDAAATEEDTPVTIAVLANDADPEGDPLHVEALGEPTAGSVAVAEDGSVTYTPPPDFTGTATFTYTVSDGDRVSDPATVTVAVSPVNDAPVAQDDAAATEEDTPVTIAVLANDADPFTYTVSDGDRVSDPATVTVAVR